MNLKSGGFYEDRQRLDQLFERARLSVEIATADCSDCERAKKMAELERMRAMMEDEQNGGCNCA